MSTFDYSVFWKETIKQIKEEFEKDGKTSEFVMWIEPITYSSSSQNIITVSVPSSFFSDQLKTRGYLTALQSKITELSGQDIKIESVISKTPANKKEPSPVPEKKAESTVSENKPDLRHPLLKEEYTFEKFVKGDNNSFAYNAALAISKNPGKAYNPVLIYGGVGLGKTHLMQAIGNEIYSKTGGKAKIIYITAENFTNEFIQSISTNKMTEFKNKYRKSDVLLIDDIHFFKSKDGTQEELFHTFDALYNSSKQLVFTCDRPLSEIKNISDRLRSRFERGLNVDLAPPDFETRQAILNKKLEGKNIHIPKEVLQLIAKNVSSNVRDLEAALTKLCAYSELIGKEVTLEIAQQQLKDTFGSPKQGNISIETIQKVVAEYNSISFVDLKGKKRTKNIVFPRQLAMYITKELTEYSTTEIGAEFGGRDHTTVMHSIEKIEEDIKADPSLKQTIDIIKRKIYDFKKQ